jgi:phosphatidylethanolamine/phosphatidyl-N-methylethanolamine N-methyltransferase
VRQVRRTPDEWVLELGAGTGVVSRALLAGGVPPERLTVLEIVPDMAENLRARLPGVEVVEGDARALPDLIPRGRHGRIGTVICGIPMVLLRLAEQRRFIDAIEAVAPGRGFLH